MIFKRLSSNIIDFAVYLLVFFISYKLVTPGFSIQQLYYLYFIAFITTFVIPITIIGNTVGKELVGLEWSYSNSFKLKLCIKYFVYYILLTPSINIMSAISDFPYLRSDEFPTDGLFGLKFQIIYLIVDIVFFIASFGKYHIADYILDIQISQTPFKRKPIITLAIVYLFSALLLIANVYLYKYGISLKNIDHTISSSIKTNHYSPDLFPNSNIISVDDVSSNVFTPSKPTTFLYEQKVSQKTIHVLLTKNIFYSENERRNVCMNVVQESIRNSIFSKTNTVQTRIVLSYFKPGVFLEYYHYYYIYYFENHLPKWGIYGGILADSNTMKEYVRFARSYQLNKIRRIENELDMTLDDAIHKASEDKFFAHKLDSLFTSIISTQIDNHGLVINVDSAKLSLKKIDFTDAALQGYARVNFPFTEHQYQIFYTDIISTKIVEIDDNIEYLILLREAATEELF